MGSSRQWVLASETRYVYGGVPVIQERNGNGFRRWPTREVRTSAAPWKGRWHRRASGAQRVEQCQQRVERTRLLPLRRRRQRDGAGRAQRWGHRAGGQLPLRPVRPADRHPHRPGRPQHPTLQQQRVAQRQRIRTVGLAFPGWPVWSWSANDDLVGILPFPLRVIVRR